MGIPFSPRTVPPRYSHSRGRRSGVMNGGPVPGAEHEVVVQAGEGLRHGGPRGRSPLRGYTKRWWARVYQGLPTLATVGRPSGAPRRGQAVRTWEGRPGKSFAGWPPGTIRRPRQRVRPRRIPRRRARSRSMAVTKSSSPSIASAGWPTFGERAGMTRMVIPTPTAQLAKKARRPAAAGHRRPPGGSDREASGPPSTRHSDPCPEYGGPGRRVQPVFTLLPTAGRVT